MNKRIAVILMSLAVGASGFAATMSDAASYAKSGNNYPLLVARGAIRVYAFPRRGQQQCPALQPLAPGAIATATTALRLATPRFEARVNLDGRNPTIRVVAAAKSGYGPKAGGCNRLVWNRSLVAFIRLPHVAGASMSGQSVAVGRIGRGWLIWSWIHS
jgi:hypothetical protein